MIEMRAPVVVALVHSKELQRLQLHSKLEQWGYATVVFASASELLAALGSGRRFDLLLLVEEDFLTWNCLSAVSRVLGIPTFLLTDALDWMSHIAPGQHFQPPPLFDFAVLNGRDIELDLRIQALLQRAREQRPTPDALRRSPVHTPAHSPAFVQPAARSQAHAEATAHSVS
jgi:hypothetical protein